MCGIVGYTGPNLEIVKRAHALQAHRGPDDAGFYSDEHISLGHNRLAIIDLNPRSAQPMWDTSHRYCIVFNGEIYNYQELKHDHLSDYDFQTESDTEVILALFSKYGTAITQYLRGMYAFSIYDTLQSQVYLFRDAFGIKPLFYATSSFKLFFGSELKSVVAMLADTDNVVTLSQTNLLILLQLGYTIAPQTLYNEIKILEAGHHLVFDLKQKKSTVAKSLTYLKRPDQTNIIEKTIIENTIADVPVGIFFSGGIDSSLVTSILHKANIKLKTFTLAIKNRNGDEQFSKDIAAHLKIQPHIIPFTEKEFDEAYRDIASTIDHPAGSTSLFQTGYLAKKTVSSVKVALMGDGGDELFYGYERSLILHTLKPQSYKEGRLIERCFLRTPHFPGKNTFFSWVFRKLKLSVSYYMLQMSICRDTLTTTQWFATKKMICEKQIDPIHLDKELYLKNDLLHKNDYATAFYALEGRVPLLSEEIEESLQEEALSSLESKITKKFLRAELSKYIPKKFFDRKKIGFGIHYQSIVSESLLVKNDFNSACSYLAHLGINLRSFDYYQERSPQYCILVCAVWHSLKNTERLIGDRL